MIEQLKAYQAWRRGQDSRTMQDAGLTQTVIGESIDFAINRIAELDRENAELVAQVKALNIVVAVHERDLPNLLNKSGEDKLYLPLSVAMNSIVDAQELRKKDVLAIQAEAAIKGWWACWDWVDSDDRDKPTLIPAADQYAARVKAGTL